MADFGDEEAPASAKFTVTAKGFRRRNTDLLKAFEDDGDDAAGGAPGAKDGAAKVRLCFIL